MTFLSLLALDIASHWLQMYRYRSSLIFLDNVFIFCFTMHNHSAASLIFFFFFLSFYYLSTFLIGKASHKDVKDSTSWLFKAYYGNRTFMAYCCVSCEVIWDFCFFINYSILNTHWWATTYSQSHVPSPGSLHYSISSGGDPKWEFDGCKYSMSVSILISCCW